MARHGKRHNPIWNSDHYSFSKFAVLSTLAFAVVICFFTRDNVVRWVEAEFEIRRQEREMIRFRRDIEEMNRQIYLLSHDRDSLEKFARERFHFSAPGEDVYLE